MTYNFDDPQTREWYFATHSPKTYPVYGNVNPDPYCAGCGEPWKCDVALQFELWQESVGDGA